MKVQYKHHKDEVFEVIEEAKDFYICKGHYCNHFCLSKNEAVVVPEKPYRDVTAECRVLNDGKTIEHNGRVVYVVDALQYRLIKKHLYRKEEDCPSVFNPQWSFLMEKRDD